METGDPLLIYRNNTSQYHAKGRIRKFWYDTTYIRDKYWNGGPAINVFSVEGYEEIDVQREKVNKILGYEEEFWPQGLWRVSDHRPIDRVVRQFDV